MHQHIALTVLPVELFAHACHNNNREFQPLTFVNAHEPHSIGLFICRVGFPVINLVFLKLFHVPYKMKYALVAATLKGSRFLQ